MSEDLGVLVAKLSADVAGLKTGLAQGRQELQSFKTMATDVGASVKNALAFVGVAVGIYEIASALKSFATEAAMVGARTETLNIAMEQVGKTYTVSASSLKYYVDELKGAGITTQESMTAVTKALTTGIPLSQLKELATRARDIGVVAGINTSEALNRMMQGIITGEQETLRRLMIQVGSTDDIYKRFAVTLGKTKEELNSVEKIQAMLNEVMRLSAGFAGTAAAADASVGKQIQSMARFAEEAKNALWSLFGPVMSAAVQEMTGGWKSLQAWAEVNRDKLEAWGQAAAEVVHHFTTLIRTIITFANKSKETIKILAEFVILKHMVGWVIALGGAAVTAGASLTAMATGVTAINLAMAGWLGTVIAITGALAAYGYYQTIKKPASLEQMSSEETQLLGEAWVLTSPKKSADEFEGYETPLPGGVLGYKSPKELQAQAEKDAQAAIDKALKDAPKPLGETSKGGKGAAGAAEDLFGEQLKLMDQLRQADIQAAQSSLDLLKATNDKKRAELEKSLTEGLIDGQTYYKRLQELQAGETAAALAMIDKKRQAQAQAHQDALSDLARQAMTPEMAGFRRQEEEAKNRMVLGQLAAEAAKVKLEGEKRVTDELKRQFEVTKQIKEKTEDLSLGTAWGPIAEQEAAVQKLVLDWARTKAEALKAAGGETPEYNAMVGAGEAKLQGDIQKARYGDQISGQAQAIASGFSSLVDALVTGTADLKSGLNSLFKNVFAEGMKPGLKALEQMLTDGFKELFGSVGAGVGGAIMGVIGLVGMLLTSGGGKSSFTSSGVQSNVTSSEAVRGIIAGETSLPIAQVSESLAEAVAPHLGILRQIEANTRNSGGGGSSQVNINVQGIQTTIREAMETYFREYLLMGAR